MAKEAIYNWRTCPLPPGSPPLPGQAELQPFLTTVVGNLATGSGGSWKPSITSVAIIVSKSDSCESRSIKSWRMAKRRAEAENIDTLLALCPGDQLLFFQKDAARVLLCCLLQTQTGESYRGFAQTLAESALRQWFCYLSQMGGVQVPSRSRSQDYSELVDASGFLEVVMTLIQSASSETRLSDWSEVEFSNICFWPKPPSVW